MRRSFLALLAMLPGLGAAVWLFVIEDPETSVANRLDACVVRVMAEGPGGAAPGTGFVVNDDFVVTNFHVVRAHVEDGWRLIVIDRHAPDDVRRLPAEIVEGFPCEDLAVLSVKGLDRPAVTFAAGEREPPAKGGRCSRSASPAPPIDWARRIKPAWCEGRSAGSSTRRGRPMVRSSPFFSTPHPSTPAIVADR